VKQIKQKIKAFLLWSQGYTKADMLYLAKGSFWVAFGQFFNGALSLILVIAFANLLPKETYGMYRYIISIAGILNIFTLTGMNNAVSRAVAKGNESILRPAVLYQLKWNLLMFLVLAILSGYYYAHNNSTLTISFLILGIFIPPTLAFNTYGAYLDGKKRFGTANILSTLSTFTYSAGTLVILFLTEEVLWFIVAYAITTFIPSFVFYLYTMRKFEVPTDKAQTEDTFKFGWELTYIRLLGPIFSQIDKIILWHFWGPVPLATYSLATAIPGRAILFIKSWVAIGFPKFTEKTPEQINLVFNRRILQGLFIGSLVTVSYVFISPFIFKYLLPQYIEGIFYSQLLAFSFIFALPNRYISLLFTAQRQSRQIFINNIIVSFVGIFLFISLGIFGGILGLVLAHNLYNMLGMLISIMSWKFKYPKQFA
jgi:O-antigen/teichoic acid export membrane protein